MKFIAEDIENKIFIGRQKFKEQFVAIQEKKSNVIEKPKGMFLITLCSVSLLLSINL